MKAIFYNEYGSADILQFDDIPEAAEPGPGEIKIKVKASSVNPIDWKVRAGYLQKIFPQEFPVSPGRDGAGVIESVGSDVTEFKSGNNVVFVSGRGKGASAEYIILPTDRISPMPDTLSFSEAAGIPLSGVTSWIAIAEDAGELDGRKVLIHAGAGGVGGYAIQIARHFGAEVSATCSHANVDFVESLGASQVIAYDNQDFVEEVSEMDVVFDTMGGDVHKRSYDVLKKGGIMVCVNAAPFEDQSKKFGVTTKVIIVKDEGGPLRKLMALTVEGEIKALPVQVFPAAQAADAHRLSETGHIRGKIVLVFD